MALLFFNFDHFLCSSCSLVLCRPMKQIIRTFPPFCLIPYSAVYLRLRYISTLHSAVDIDFRSFIFFYLAAIDSFLNTHRPGSYFTTPHVGLHISSAALICYRVYIRLSLSLASIYFFPFGRDWLTECVERLSVYTRRERGALNVFL